MEQVVDNKLLNELNDDLSKLSIEELQMFKLLAENIDGIPHDNNLGEQYDYKKKLGQRHKVRTFHQFNQTIDFAQAGLGNSKRKSDFRKRLPSVQVAMPSMFSTSQRDQINWQGEHFKIDSMPKGRARSTLKAANVHLERPPKLEEIPKKYIQNVREKSPAVTTNRAQFEKFRSLDPNLVMNPHQHQLKPPVILPKARFRKRPPYLQVQDQENLAESQGDESRGSVHKLQVDMRVGKEGPSPTQFNGSYKFPNTLVNPKLVMNQNTIDVSLYISHRNQTILDKIQKMKKIENIPVQRQEEVYPRPYISRYRKYENQNKFGRSIMAKNDSNDLPQGSRDNSPKMLRKESELDEIADAKIIDIKEMSEEKEQMTDTRAKMKDASLPAGTSIVDPVDKTKSFMDSSANLMLAQISTPGTHSYVNSISESKSRSIHQIDHLQLMQKQQIKNKYKNQSPQMRKVKEMRNQDLPIEKGEYTFPKEDGPVDQHKKTHFSDLVMKVQRRGDQQIQNLSTKNADIIQFQAHNLHSRTAKSPPKTPNQPNKVYSPDDSLTNLQNYAGDLSSIDELAHRHKNRLQKQAGDTFLDSISSPTSPIRQKRVDDLSLGADTSLNSQRLGSSPGVTEGRNKTNSMKITVHSMTKDHEGSFRDQQFGDQLMNTLMTGTTPYLEEDRNILPLPIFAKPHVTPSQLSNMSNLHTPNNSGDKKNAGGQVNLSDIMLRAINPLLPQIQPSPRQVRHSPQATHYKPGELEFLHGLVNHSPPRMGDNLFMDGKRMDRLTQLNKNKVTGCIDDVSKQIKLEDRVLDLEQNITLHLNEIQQSKTNSPMKINEYDQKLVTVQHQMSQSSVIHIDAQRQNSVSQLTNNSQLNLKGVYDRGQGPGRDTSMNAADQQSAQDKMSNPQISVCLTVKDNKSARAKKSLESASSSIVKTPKSTPMGTGYSQNRMIKKMRSKSTLNEEIYIIQLDIPKKPKLEPVLENPIIEPRKVARKPVVPSPVERDVVDSITSQTRDEAMTINNGEQSQVMRLQSYEHNLEQDRMLELTQENLAGLEDKDIAKFKSGKYQYHHQQWKTGTPNLLAQLRQDSSGQNKIVCCQPIDISQKRYELTPDQRDQLREEYLVVDENTSESTSKKRHKKVKTVIKKVKHGIMTNNSQSDDKYLSQSMYKEQNERALKSKMTDFKIALIDQNPVLNSEASLQSKLGNEFNTVSKVSGTPKQDESKVDVLVVPGLPKPLPPPQALIYMSQTNNRVFLTSREKMVQERIKNLKPIKIKSNLDSDNPGSPNRHSNHPDLFNRANSLTIVTQNEGELPLSNEKYLSPRNSQAMVSELSSYSPAPVTRTRMYDGQLTREVIKPIQFKDNLKDFKIAFQTHQQMPYRLKSPHNKMKIRAQSPHATDHTSTTLPYNPDGSVSRMCHSNMQMADQNLDLSIVNVSPRGNDTKIEKPDLNADLERFNQIRQRNIHLNTCISTIRHQSPKFSTKMPSPRQNSKIIVDLPPTNKMMFVKGKIIPKTTTSPIQSSITTAIHSNLDLNLNTPRLTDEQSRFIQSVIKYQNIESSLIENMKASQKAYQDKPKLESVLSKFGSNSNKMAHLKSDTMQKDESNIDPNDQTILNALNQKSQSTAGHISKEDSQQDNHNQKFQVNINNQLQKQMVIYSSLKGVPSLQFSAQQQSAQEFLQPLDPTEGGTLIASQKDIFIANQANNATDPDAVNEVMERALNSESKSN